MDYNSSAFLCQGVEYEVSAEIREENKEIFTRKKRQLNMRLSYLCRLKSTNINRCIMKVYKYDIKE